MASYDVLVIGGGPAGCSAALTLRLRGKSVLLADSGGGALEKARRIENYPGMPHISGSELIAAMRRQVEEAGIEIRRAPVQRVLPMGKSFSAMLGNEILSCRGVLLATGAPRAALLPGESELLGQGVSYCATCDGMFYKGKDVAVIGAFSEAVEEANFLATLAGHVDYFAELPHDTAALQPGIARMEEKPTALSKREDRIALDTGTRERRYDGVFILRPVLVMSQLLPELATQQGAIQTDGQGRTNLPRVCAAGDAVGAPYQAAKAVGEGNTAALTLCKMLDEEAAG